MAIASSSPGGAGVAGRLRQSAYAGLLALLLCTPIIMFVADPDPNTGQLRLAFRPIAVLVFMAVAFIGRFVVLTAAERPKRARAVKAARPASAWLGKTLSVAGLAFLFVYPIGALQLFGAGGALKWVDTYGIQILIYVMLGWGLNIVVGLAGLLDLGYVAFYAVGAYSYTLLTITFHLSFWICLPIAGMLAACWGMILGFPVLRLRGDYLAIVTLAFGEIIRTILVNWTNFSGGSAGISSIPKITFFGLAFADRPGGFDDFFGFDYSPIHAKVFLYYVILALALITSFVTVRLRRLPIGRAWEALREDEVACRSLGVNTTNTKLTAFALGAFFGGLAGSFFAVRQGFISPESFTFNESATILAIVVLGGMGSQIGVAMAAIALIGGFEMLRELGWLKDLMAYYFGIVDFDPAQYRGLLFGLAMVVMMVVRPRGFVSTRTPSIFLKERKAVSGALVKEGRG